MRRVAVLIVILCVSALLLPLSAQQTGAFLVALTTSDGQPLPSISPADLAVQEAGQPAKVVKIEPKSFPVRITLALENSRGLADALPQLRAGAKGFVTALPAGVEVTLVSTAPQPRVVVKSTTDKEAVIKAVDRLAPESTSGRFIEALTEQIDRWDKDKERGLYTPILVIMGSTIGEEVVRDNWVKEAMGKLDKLAGVTVHALMYNAPITSTGSTGESQVRLAEEAVQRTRGRYELFSAPQRIATLLPEIGADIAKTQVASQYLVTIERPAGATGRLGALSMSPPGGVKVGKITRVEERR
jgi:hypothetical protein